MTILDNVTLYGWPANQTIPLFWRETRQRILGPEISPYPEGDAKESWLDKGAGRQLAMGQQRGESAEELAWNHEQMRSTPETVAEKIGSSEEDWVKMSAFQLLVEFSLVTHVSVSPHMHVVLHTLFLLWVNPKHCSCLFVCFIFSCPSDRILVVARNVRYPPRTTSWSPDGRKKWNSSRKRMNACGWEGRIVT